jgi:anti-anti-sigma factor
MATVFTGAVVAKVQDVHFVLLRMESIMQGPEIQCVVKTFDDLVEDQQVRRLVIDFQSVHYFASQFISLLIQLNRRLTHAGGKLILMGMHPRLWELFRITGIDPLFTSVPTRELAMIYMKNDSERQAEEKEEKT